MSIKLIQEIYFDESKILNLFNLLSQLTNSPIINKDKLLNIINNLPNNHFIFVYLNNNKEIIGTITLIIEQKIIHNGKCVGHIEDLVVDINYNKQGIATELINHCKKIAINLNCYKIILNCKKELIPFYIKNNFNKQDECMCYNLI